MNLIVDPGDFPQFQEPMNTCVNDVLQSHPLLRGDVSLPDAGELVVRIVATQRTGINHVQYKLAGNIVLSLDEDDAFDRRTDNSGPDHSRLARGLSRILCHELAHFIDARLDRSFSYDEVLRPSDPRVLSVHYNVWDAFIDGRLGTEAPYSLSQREEEAAEVNGVPPELIRAAWAGKYRTYPAVVAAAAEFVEQHREA
jgi:hypothetical protein